MKRILLSLLLGSAMLNASAQTERVTIAEIGTAITCPPCATYVGPLVEQLNKYDNVVTIAYQGNYAQSYYPDLTYPMYEFAEEDISRKLSALGLSGYPTVWLDGSSDHPGNVTDDMIEAALAVEPSFEIDVTTSRIDADSNSFNITVNAKNLDLWDVKKAYLHVAVIEDHVEFKNNSGNIIAPGTNGEKSFHYVMRKMFPDANGTELEEGMLKGTTTTVEATYTIDTSVLDYTQLRVLAWVQKRSGKTTYQAARSAERLFYVGIEDLVEREKPMAIFPTVASDFVNIEYALKNNSAVTIDLISSNGQSIQIIKSMGEKSAGNHHERLMTNQLANGIYFVRLAINDQVYTQQIVVNN